MPDFGLYQTHVSRLLFTPDRVYKWKRPVRFGFLDFASVEARWRACRSEVELNRRLAPDVYEGVGEFVAPDGGREPVVVMRRQPDRYRLSNLVGRDDPLLGRALPAVAAELADFHRRAVRGPGVDRDCTPDALQALWADNLDELEQLAAGIVDTGAIGAARQAASTYLAGRRALIEERLAAGRAVDGHGDLMCDDTFVLPDGPRILDCLEFDDRLRHGDALADAASLAMDLESRGRPDLAGLFLDAYRDWSGDAWPDSLAHLHIAYRATVRAKVECIRDREEGDGHQEPDRPRAGYLVELALGHLAAGAVRMVIVGGLPGTGKTTLARGLAQATGWPVLSSDVTRKQLAGLRPDADARAAFGSGIYSEDMTALVYEVLLDEARRLMELGRSVVVDASWLHRYWRDEARAVARQARAELVPVRCRTTSALARARIAGRDRSTSQASDATPAIYDEMAAALEPWLDAVSVDTAAGADDALGEVLAVLGPA